MASRCFQPVGQKRLTNIAVVRLRKAGVRFEIACYQNKVRDWRNGIEKDLDEVLQSTTIYTNVSKGVVSKEKDLMTAFGTNDEKAICLEILQKGELQVSDKERKLEYDNLFRDVASVLVDKCVNPETSRPYTITILERALRDVHFNVDPKKAAKQQALLEALPILQAKFPIERARMRLRLTGPSDQKQQMVDMLDSYDAVLESVDDVGLSSALVVQVEPGAFRELHNRLQSEMQGHGRVEILTMAVVAEGLQADEFSHSRPLSQAQAPPPVFRPDQEEGPATATTGNGGCSSATAARPQAVAAVTSAAEGAGSHVCASSQQGPAAASSTRGPDVAPAGEVVYARGPIEGLPEAHASRKERFAELDSLQPGWEVELRSKGPTVEAVFFSPTGEKVGAYANARRMALAASKSK